MDPQWAFILNTTKRSLIESIPIIGATGYANINLQANPPYQIIANNLPPVTNNFLDLIDTKISYTLLTTDDVVQVSSITYESLYLPTAVGKGGKMYYISNRSTQTIKLWAQPGDFIDKKQFIKIAGGSHTSATSNNYNEWLLD